MREDGGPLRRATEGMAGVGPGGEGCSIWDCGKGQPPRCHIAIVIHHNYYCRSLTVMEIMRAGPCVMLEEWARTGLARSPCQPLLYLSVNVIYSRAGSIWLYEW